VEGVKVSALEEYGLRCMMFIARQGEGKRVSARDIGASEGLSLPYVHKILQFLRDAELVESRRGVGGGYQLARPASDLSIGRIVRALEGGLEQSEICGCFAEDSGRCQHEVHCTLLPVWAKLGEIVMTMLDEMTLAMLIEPRAAVVEHLARRTVVSTDKLCPVGSRIEGVSST
jgi:Rrf2 family transcriptional regulator, iron-sulfur cluster assembly transcription factor